MVTDDIPPPPAPSPKPPRSKLVYLRVPEWVEVEGLTLRAAKELFDDATGEDVILVRQSVEDVSACLKRQGYKVVRV